MSKCTNFSREQQIWPPKFGCGAPYVLLYFYNLSWFPVSNYIKNMQYTGDRKFIVEDVCQKLS